MTRLVATDDYAQALHRVFQIGRGWVLASCPAPMNDQKLVAWSAVDEVAQVGPADRFYALARNQWRGTVDCPLPGVGEAFFVGEAWTPRALVDLGIERQVHIVYRAGAEATVLLPEGSEVIIREHGNRPSRHMPCWAARTRLRVLSRRALQLQEVAGEMAMAAGLPTSNGLYEIPLGWKTRLLTTRQGRAEDPEMALHALRAWWSRWHGAPYRADAWAFAAEVEATQPEYPARAP